MTPTKAPFRDPMRRTSDPRDTQIVRGLLIGIGIALLLWLLLGGTALLLA